MCIYIQWWESAGDKFQLLSLLSKPHHGELLTGGNMLVSHDDGGGGGGGDDFQDFFYIDYDDRKGSRRC